MSFKGLVRNSVSSDEKTDTCINVMEWIWNKRNQYQNFYIQAPGGLENKLYPNHFTEKNDFIQTSSSIPCLNETIKNVIQQTSSSGT